MSLFAWLLLAYWLLGAIATVSQIGEPRKPISNGMAVLVMLSHTAWALALLNHEGVL